MFRQETSLEVLNSPVSANEGYVTVSVVSHGHGSMVATLVSRLLTFPEVASVIVTLNRREDLALPASPRVKIVRNVREAGFAANNNAAFAYCRTPYFCLVNPDVECAANPFPSLLAALRQRDAAVAAPMVHDGEGRVEASARRFPTLLSLAAKAIGRCRSDYPGAGNAVVPVDWVGGMFMLFKSPDYRGVGMLDEGYHLYYEDVDICRRLAEEGRRVLYCTDTVICHRARRHSRIYWTYRAWHAKSMCRYFATGMLARRSSVKAFDPIDRAAPELGLRLDGVAADMARAPLAAPVS